jgi:Fe-Mn family superoxide dismutase
MNLDVWEHAYYLDYENERGKFVDSYWNIVNWEAINIKLDTIMSTVGK